MKSKIAADRVLKRFSRKIRKEDAFSGECKAGQTKRIADYERAGYLAT